MVIQNIAEVYESIRQENLAKIRRCVDCGKEFNYPTVATRCRPCFYEDRRRNKKPKPPRPSQAERLFAELDPRLQVVVMRMMARYEGAPEPHILTETIKMVTAEMACERACCAGKSFEERLDAL